MSGTPPTDGGLDRWFPNELRIALIRTEDGTEMYFDPTLAYFKRTPGALVRGLPGDGSWQQFPVAVDVIDGT